MPSSDINDREFFETNIKLRYELNCYLTIKIVAEKTAII